MTVGHTHKVQNTQIKQATYIKAKHTHIISHNITQDPINLITASANIDSNITKVIYYMISNFVGR